MAENTAQKQKKHGFQKGKSGNPSGRPKGALNKTTMAVRELLDGEAEELTRKAVELAKGGDITALKLCLDRVSPCPKDRAVTFTMPEEICKAESLPLMTAHILKAVGDGELTPSEGERISSIITAHARAIELNELEARVSKLEAENERLEAAR